MAGMSTTPAQSALPLALRTALKDGRAERSLQLERNSIDANARTAVLAFATEAPYQRYWGVEILEITPQAMRQERLRAGANLLVDHDTRDVVGVVESVEIGTDRVARAVVRFGRSVRAEEVWQDVQDGIRRNVSVGYTINSATLVSQTDGVETYVVKDWVPYEISVVSCPADINAGFGRSMEQSNPEPEPGAAPAADAQPEQENPPQEKTMSDIQTPEVRNHANEISKIAAGVPGGAELALSAIQRGLTVEQFQQEAIKALSNKPVPTADLGMTHKEAKRFSIMRALNAMANPSDMAAQRAAAYEFECSEAVAKVMGRAAQGFYVPNDVLKRDLTVANQASAGTLVDTTLMTGSFIDLLRAKMVMGGLGVQYIGGLVGDVDMPRQTSTAATYWVAEQGKPIKSNQAFDRVRLTPKTVGAKTVVSRKMRQQSSMDIEALIQRDLATSLALEMERVVINGSGENDEPLGLLNVPGFGALPGGPNGAAIGWDEIVDMETLVAVANADMGSLNYLTNTKVRGKLKKTFVDGPGTGERVWQNGAQPLNGYGCGITNLVPSNLTKGTGTNLSAAAFGDFSTVVVGNWGALDILIDNITGGDAGDISVRVLQDMDVAFRRLESFAVVKDIITG